TRHFLVWTGRIESVASRQVDELDRFAGRQDHPPSLPLDRHTGVVGDLLPGAGQGVEQRALAGVGVTDERGGPQSAHSSFTVIARACERRTATVIRPTVSAIGSRPAKMPRCAMTTWAPSSIPIARSRLASSGASRLQSIATISAARRGWRRSSVVWEVTEEVTRSRCQKVGLIATGSHYYLAARHGTEKLSRKCPRSIGCVWPRQNKHPATAQGTATAPGSAPRRTHRGSAGPEPWSSRTASRFRSGGRETRASPPCLRSR